MSVNRNVTVPTGGEPRRAAAGRGSAVSVMVLLLRDGSEPPGQLAEDRERQGRLLEEHPLEVPRREGEARRRRLRDDLGNARLAIEDGQLAEELARPELRERLPVANDADAAVDDDEEARPDLALPGDHASGGKLDLCRRRGDGRDVARVEAAEQRTAGDEL